jgi:thiamine-monophosphate kinase
VENEFVDYLCSQLPPHPLVRIGPGDDAAVLAAGADEDAVVTTDLLTEGVDFLLDEVDARRIGRKALAVNLSDLASMAARPEAVVVALALPRAGGFRLAVELYEGMLPLAEQFGTAIAGGDTNSWDGALVIAVTAIGRLTDRGPLLRSGCQVGDRLLVTGSLGGSIAGHQFDFRPRVNEALQLHADYQLNAGIDISDGLALDVSRLVGASNCGAVLQLDTIPISDAARCLAKSSSDGQSPLDHALGDGEDFELVLAVEPNEARRLMADQPLDVRLTDIGSCVDQSGLWSACPDGRLIPLHPTGYEHQLDG